MLELLISVSLFFTYRINLIGELRLVDILLLMIFLWGILGKWKFKCNKTIITLMLLRVVYIVVILFFKSKLDLSTIMSMGYFFEFMLVYLIICLFDTKLEFEKLWKIGYYTLFINSLITIYQCFIYGTSVRNYGLMSSTSTLYFLPYILYGFFINKSLKNRNYYRIISVLGIVSTFLSEQRSLLLVLALAFFVFIVIDRKSLLTKLSKIIGITITIIIVSYFLLPNTIQTFYIDKFMEIFTSLNTENNSPMYIRYVLWETAINIFISFPFFGIGSGIFARLSVSEFSQYTSRSLIKRAVGLSTHNNFLEYLCELGIIGTLITYSLIFEIIRDIKRKVVNLNLLNDQLFRILYASFLALCIYDFIGQSSFFYFWSYMLLLIYIYI